MMCLNGAIFILYCTVVTDCYISNCKAPTKIKNTAFVTGMSLPHKFLEQDKDLEV